MAYNQVVDYYNRIAPTYDESRFSNSYGRFIDVQERRILDTLIDTGSDEQRLELACGTGRLTGYATHALDASDEMMTRARQRHPEVEFRLASATDTGYADGFFDVVYCFHLMMHLDMPTIGLIVDEAWRVLKSGGRLIFDIPSSLRRRLLRHNQATWHGAAQLSTSELKSLASGKFALRRSFGVAMLPIHKIPESWRPRLTSFDYALANSFMREYSSYLVFELVKTEAIN